MNIQLAIKQLRGAANALEMLLQFNENDKIASKILGKTRKYKKYVHWTQKPENRAKVKKMAKKVSAIKRLNNNG